MDIKQKIQEQLELLLDCEDAGLVDIYIKRVKTLMEIGKFELRQNSESQRLSECKVFCFD